MFGITACFSFLLLCWITFAVQKSQTQELRSSFHDREAEFHGLIEGFQELPPLPDNETLFISSPPSYFDEDHLTAAAQLALRRMDITTRIVEQFPEESRYRLKFENFRMYRITDNK
jgi:hypothetical protein